ncbi:MAG: cytidine deaminase [Desulfurococcales archaeon]|jgi:cytidine deaminase
MGDREEMLESLLKIMGNSYSPYSRFRVASAVMCSDGRIFTGVNVENSSYGLSVCAERVAIFKAVSEGCREITKVYVMSDYSEPIPPCGACLQVVSEFSRSGDVEIIMYSPKGSSIKRKLSELLPLRFNKDVLRYKV